MLSGCVCSVLYYVCVHGSSYFRQCFLNLSDKSKDSIAVACELRYCIRRRRACMRQELFASQSVLSTGRSSADGLKSQMHAPVLTLFVCERVGVMSFG